MDTGSEAGCKGMTRSGMQRPARRRRACVSVAVMPRLLSVRKAWAMSDSRVVYTLNSTKWCTGAGEGGSGASHDRRRWPAAGGD